MLEQITEISNLVETHKSQWALYVFCIMTGIIGIAVLNHKIGLWLGYLFAAATMLVAIVVIFFFAVSLVALVMPNYQPPSFEVLTAMACFSYVGYVLLKAYLNAGAEALTTKNTEQPPPENKN